jgi:hypothetical protein
MLPQLIERKLTKEELARYGEPYPTVASRKGFANGRWKFLSMASLPTSMRSSSTSAGG